MSGIWFGYLAMGILLLVALVLGYQDRKARHKQRHLR
jgi:hypothetical protein